ncbi:hypothetical protein [Pelotomaculum propionicicum]|uniref:Uncharacterized protein n=1 Tax=Pelotomaculum propionicicum TaxID=258475 RepID=A0A4Y7RC53_9FIRM|nr:hypothetical protein [Pelotomaculum propionicicum]TEB06300.1 hypothetical protein Pmgp_03787 [Pelotomaculum propionicicum]
MSPNLGDNNEWPTHLYTIKPTPEMTIEELKTSLKEYFRWAKGSGSAADFLNQCSKDEMPGYIVEVLKEIRSISNLANQTEVQNEAAEEVAASES